MNETKQNIKNKKKMSDRGCSGIGSKNKKKLKYFFFIKLIFFVYKIMVFK